MRFKTSFFEEDEEINMAPMIDMVFLLLIFFMVASHMEKMDRTPVDLPVADQANIPEQRGSRTLITLRSQDLTGERVDILMNLQQLQLDGLKDKLKKIIENNPETSICLRVDRYAKNRHVKKVMEACVETGVSDVIFATFEAGP
jgi:biopolymer transport protein ExbD